MRSLLAQMSGQDRIITVPKLYVQLCDGNITEAIMLNQIVFYSDKSSRTDGYFYKSHHEWLDEVCLTERQVRSLSKKLKDKGWIETKIMKANGAPTTHYKLLFDNLVDSITTLCSNGKQQNVVIDYDNMSQSLTEITTESTTVNNNNDDSANEPVKSAFKFFEQNGFGILTSHVADKMGAWIDDTNEELVIYALQIATENGVLRWNYVESILRDWHNKKYTNVEQVVAAEAKRTAGRDNNGRIPRNRTSTPRDDASQSEIDETNERRKKLAGIESNRNNDITF